MAQSPEFDYDIGLFYAGVYYVAELWPVFEYKANKSNGGYTVSYTENGAYRAMGQNPRLVLVKGKCVGYRDYYHAKGY